MLQQTEQRIGHSFRNQVPQKSMQCTQRSSTLQKKMHGRDNPILVRTIPGTPVVALKLARLSHLEDPRSTRLWQSSPQPTLENQRSRQRHLSSLCGSGPIFATDRCCAIHRYRRGRGCPSVPPPAHQGACAPHTARDKGEWERAPCVRSKGRAGPRGEGALTER